MPKVMSVPEPMPGVTVKFVTHIVQAPRKNQHRILTDENLTISKRTRLRLKGGHMALSNRTSESTELVRVAIRLKSSLS